MQVVGEATGQADSLQLSAGTARQRLDEDDPRRHFVGGQRGDQVIAQVLFARRGACVEHHRSRDILAERRMGNGEGDRLPYGGVTIQRVVHSQGHHLHPTPIDHLLEPPRQRQVAMVVELPFVARHEPGLSACVAVPAAVPLPLVARRDAGAADHNLSDDAGRAMLAVDGEYGDVGACRQADGTRMMDHAGAGQTAAAYLRRGLRHAVDLHDGHLKNRLEPLSRDGAEWHGDGADKPKVMRGRGRAGTLNLFEQG